MRIIVRLARGMIIPLLFALTLFALPVAGNAFVAVSVTVAPPLLPVYAQPAIPGPGYFWAPGYWAWGPNGYYWVPGTWVLAPAVGLLWTPGYWWWHDGFYGWHGGYWGPHVGFYGGVNYGFGYNGVGYAGGFWDHGTIRYNTAFNNIGSAHITNVYNETVTTNNVAVTHVSYNGGEGGLTSQPNADEQAAEHDPHVQPTALQVKHEHFASIDHALLASVNHGRPAIAATPRPAAFAAHGVVSAQGSDAPHKPKHPAGKPKHEGDKQHDELPH